MARPDPPVPQVDYLRTCVRPDWDDLPSEVRAAVAGVAGSAVVRAAPSATSGFTGGFAAVLDLRDGRRVFAKAGSGTNPHLLDAYAREARVLDALPARCPAPALVGSRQLLAGAIDEHAWQLLVTEAVDGRVPQPWTEASVRSVHDASVLVGEVLAPQADRWSEHLAEHYLSEPAVAGCYADLARGDLPLTWGQPGWLPDRLGVLQDLVEAAVLVLTGEVPGHADLRADNVLVGPDGRATFVDWDWVMRGPAWTDLVGVLALARGDGVDAEAWLRRSPLTRDADPEAVDTWLALVPAYMLQAADRPVWPAGPPAVRVHQRRSARLFLDWLGERRGWTGSSPVGTGTSSTGTSSTGTSSTRGPVGADDG